MAISTNTNKLPLGTESVKGPQNKAVNRTPGNYYSSLRLFGFSLPAAPNADPAVAPQDFHKLWIPTPLAVIDNGPPRNYEPPTATPFGLQIYNILNADLATVTSTRALVQVTRATDQQSLVTLMADAQHRVNDFYDEAPLVRFLLLWQTMAQPADYAAISERAMSEIAINTRTGPLTVTWGGCAHKEDQTLRPGRAAGSSTISVTTITEYTMWNSGERSHNMDMTTPDVIVPVRQSWSNRDFLIPYILSFTTTGWWNHSAVVSSRFVHTTTGNYIGRWSAKFFAQACLPVVSGNWSNILLVVVDKAGPNNARDSFYIAGAGAPIHINYGEEFEGFAQEIYEWLGCFEHPDGPIPDRSNQMSTAWTHLLETVAIKGVATKAIATVAEMTRTRFNGSFVKTGSAPGPNDNGGVRLLPYVLQPAVVPIIRGQHLPDLNANLVNWAAIDPHLITLTCWRSTPLVQMHKSCMWLGDGDDHQQNRNFAASWKDYSPEYQLTESYHVNRILIARDIFQHSDSCRRYLFRGTSSLMVFMSETSCLIGAVSTWMYTYYGMTVPIINRLIASDRNVPYHQHELLSRATNGLVIPVYGQVWEPYTGDPLINIIRNVMPNQNFTFGMWKSLTLPWWLVGAVAEKFGVVFKLSIPVTEICVSAGYDDDEWEQGYSIDASAMWASLPLLTSDDRYLSNGAYRIMTYVNRAYDPESWAAWSSDLCYDNAVRVQCAPIMRPCPQLNITEVNILTIPYKQANTLRDKQGPICFVSRSTPNSPFAHMRLENKIRFPDPVMDHLIRAGKAALPELAAGNVPGAIKAALLSAADPALNWALEQTANLTGLELFRPST